MVEIVRTPIYCKILDKIVLLCIAAVIMIGIWTKFGSNLSRDYWIDEIWRINDITHSSSYLAVTQPVQLGEYLAAEFSWSIFGESEFSSRLPIALASLLSLLLLSYYCFKKFSPAVALFIITLISVSPGYLEHGYEFKPYSFELLFFAASLILFNLIRSSSSRILYEILFLCLFGIFAFSALPFLVFLFIFVVLRIFNLQKSKLKSTYLLLMSILSASALVYYKFMSPLADKHGMWRFWKPYYLQSLDQLNNFISQQIPFIVSWYAFPVPGIAEIPGLLICLILVVVFAVTLLLNLSHKDLFFLWLIVPAVIMLLLGVLGKYPVGTRVSTFYYPAITLAFGYMIDYIYSYSKARPFSLRPMLQLCLVVASITCVLQWFPSDNPGTNRHIQESKVLISFLREKGEKNQILCAGYHARMLLDHYYPEYFEKFKKCTLPTPKEITEEEAKAFITELAASSNEDYWLMSVHRDQGYEIWKETLKNFGFQIKNDFRKSSSYLILAEK